MTDIVPPGDGEYAQMFCFRIDMVGSELVLKNTSPGQLRALNSGCRSLVEDAVGKAGGRMGAWHGDGNVAVFGTKADEDPLIRHGEEIARGVLDAFYSRFPDKRFRIGVGTAPARFWEDTEAIDSPAIVLAARLEDEARNVASGSVLLIPAQVFSALEPAVQRKYARSHRQLGDIVLYAYVPPGAGVLTPLPSVPAKSPPAVGPSAPTVEQPSAAPRAWPSEQIPFLLIEAYPTDAPDAKLFKLDQHKKWVIEHILELPIGSPIFSEDSLRFQRLTVFLAEKFDAPRIQIAEFFETGRFHFGDCGWCRLPGWQGAFFPQVLNSILPKVVAFGCRYFTEALRRTDNAWFRVEIGNLAGCERKTQRIGAIPPKRFVYDRDVTAGGEIDLKTGDQGAFVKALYDQIMIQSELDPAAWGFGTD